MDILTKKRILNLIVGCVGLSGCGLGSEAMMCESRVIVHMKAVDSDVMTGQYRVSFVNDEVEYESFCDKASEEEVNQGVLACNFARVDGKAWQEDGALHTPAAYLIPRGDGFDLEFTSSETGRKFPGTFENITVSVFSGETKLFEDNVEFSFTAGEKDKFESERCDSSEHSVDVDFGAAID